MRSYPGDRESVRSGRRSRRGEDSSSGYSDNERRYRRSVSRLKCYLLYKGRVLAPVYDIYNSFGIVLSCLDYVLSIYSLYFSQGSR